MLMADKRARRVAEAQGVLTAFGLPVAQRNERAALTLLALLDLRPQQSWAAVSDPLRGVTPIMEFVAKYYGKEWAPNTRETVRRFTLHQFEQAGLVVANPDQPDRPTNSPKYCYQIESRALAAIRTFRTPEWENALRRYLADARTLAQRYAQMRDMQGIPLDLASGITIKLSPGGQNALVEKVINEFCPRFTPAGKPLYIGDTDEKWAYFDADYLRNLGVVIEEHGKMPDVVVYFSKKNWLVLIEAVTSHGPVSPKRLTELRTLFAGCKVGLVFVTAFLNRRSLLKYLREIAWETEVWVADAPDHMVHFNGERFLGPY
jgi:type II restriction enzyme